MATDLITPDEVATLAAAHHVLKAIETRAMLDHDSRPSGMVEGLADSAAAAVFNLVNTAHHVAHVPIAGGVVALFAKP